MNWKGEMSQDLLYKLIAIGVVILVLILIMMGMNDGIVSTGFEKLRRLLGVF